MRSTKSPSWSERLVGLGPVAPPPHAFRLGPHGIAYAGFRAEGDVYALAASASAELPADTFQEGLLGGPAREPERFAEAVRELVRSLPQPPREASLVLPEGWLRLAFADLNELPVGAGRDEVLRWKLRRQVPFRVDELRLAALEVAPLPAQSPEEPFRVMLGFAVEALLGQVEDAFAAAGVRLGRITCESLALLAALRPADADELLAVALVDAGGYSLLFARGGEPVLHRHKGHTAGLPEVSRGPLVGRDLRLTRSFLAEQLPEVPVARALVAAPAAVERDWLELMSESLAAAAERLGRDHLPPLAAITPAPEWRQLAPLLGAATREVA